MATYPNTEPIFLRQPFRAVVKLTDQVGSRSATGQIETLLTAGDCGAVVEGPLLAIPLGTTDATILRLYRMDAGGAKSLFREWALAAVADASPAIAATELTMPTLISPASATGLRLAPGESLLVALSVSAGSNGWNIWALGGQYC